MPRPKPKDPRTEPLPGAEPYRYHDTMRYSPLDNPKTFRHATRPGQRITRTRGRTLRRRATVRG